MTNYRCIITLLDGTHKIARTTKDVVAALVTGFRNVQARKITRRYKEAAEKIGISWLQIHTMIFINEYTGERLEIA